MSSNNGYSFPVTSLQYRDMSEETDQDSAEQLLGSREREYAHGNRRRRSEVSEAELVARIERERAEAAKEAANETEQRLRREYEQKLLAARAPIAAAVKSFEEQRDQYYARVEAEIVQLALSIAAKILHRESQVDPMLVAALVRLAMENMREGSSVTIRVSPGKGESWRQYFAGVTNASHIEIAEDPQLTSQDCIVETELGSANFGLEKQLKEVEQGFFDLLALRPSAK
jgi:flagellar assembly protein FliH